MTTVSCTDGYVIDPFCQRIGKIYQDYSCTLNQTDIKTNKNKFYIMQIIDTSTSGGSTSSPQQYSLFIRYGRMGEPGRISYLDSAEPGVCVGKFEKQFVSKTKNSWSNRKHFTKYKDKYYLCELDYEEVMTQKKSEPTETDKNSSSTVPQKSLIPSCSLDDRVQEFLRLVSDVNLMKNTLVQLKIDIKKMPLGKISASQIEQAYQLLKKVQKDLHLGQQALDYTDLSSEFYTLIPYACGRRKPPVINSNEMVNKYLEMVEELGNLEIANSVVENGQDGKETVHPLDSIYKEIKTEIRPMEKNSEMWKLIENYVYSTHAPTHGFKTELLDIYEIQREGEKEKFDQYCQEHGVRAKMLLWHGTRLTNYLSILKTGLILRPDTIPGVVISGKMFGQAIYTASSFSKSFNYTGWNGYSNKSSDGTACLFLAEVAVGNIDKRTSHDYYITEKSLQEKGYHSVWGQGASTPAKMVKRGDVLIPQGPLKKSGINGSLLYDEFTIYNERQINLKYIVKVRGSY